MLVAVRSVSWDWNWDVMLVNERHGCECWLGGALFLGQQGPGKGMLPAEPTSSAPNTDFHQTFTVAVVGYIVVFVMVMLTREDGGV